MPYKVTLIWRFITQGWTESWYLNSSSPVGPALNAQVLAMATARNALNGKGTVLQAVRISDYANPRKINFVDVGTTRPSPAPKNADQPNASYLAEASAFGGGNVRQCWLRGIPDDWVVYNPVTDTFETVGQLTRAFGTFRGIIVNSAWAIQAIAPLNNGATATQPIDALSSVGGAAKLTVAVAPWAVTDTIIVSGFRKPISFLNGTYGPKHWSKTGTDINPQIAITTQQASLYLGGASIRRRVTSLVQIGQFELQHPGTRRTGRELFAQRGRRSVRR